MENFIKKPILTIIVLVLIVVAVIYLEMKKPDNINNSTTATLNENSGYKTAPEIIGIDRWINSDPLRLQDLKGKVVLVDFWTYTCINCIRTLPYLKAWDEKYRDDGLIIIGVHSPEFEFEKKYENVLNAVKKYEIKYAVAQDNNFETWRNYNNRYWPHKFLIDIDGNIRYDHIGEGNYDETEKIIQKLLKERMEKLNQENKVETEISKPKEVINIDYSKVNSPEIYLGYKTSRGNFGNPEGIISVISHNYKLPENIVLNNVYLDGEWKANDDNMELVSEKGSILLKYDAKNVNIVASGKSYGHIFLDGKNIKGDVNMGEDENGSIVNFNEERLYNLISGENYGQHTIKIDVVGSGFKIYTFTFG